MQNPAPVPAILLPMHNPANVCLGEQPCLHPFYSNRRPELSFCFLARAQLRSGCRGLVKSVDWDLSHSSLQINNLKKKSMLCSMSEDRIQCNYHNDTVGVILLPPE